MSIVALYKLTLCGLACDRRSLLSDLQSLGLMHPINLHKATFEDEEAPFVPDAHKALRYLLESKHRRRQVCDATDFDCHAVVNQALANQQRRHELEDRISFLERRIECLKPWGDFSFPPLEALGGQRLWFYQVPHGQKKLFATLEHPWQQVGRDNRYLYIVVISPDKPSHEQLPLPRIRAGGLSPQELRRQLTLAQIEWEDVQAERHALTHWITLLSQNLASAEDQIALHRAEQSMFECDDVCLLQGWVAQRDLLQFQTFATQRGLALLAETPTAEDTPPTLLDNPDSLSGGEDLVRFYQTPAYTTWDPSRVVFFSFALFFAMILADAGYALVLMTVLGYFWRSLDVNATKRRLRTLALAVLSASLVYGVLAGSYFGWIPPPYTLLGMLHVLDLNNFDAMMQVSVAIGCLHLIVSNAVMAMQRRPFPRNAAPLGWIAVISGGFLIWQESEIGGSVLLAGGITLILLFSGTHKFDSPRNSVFAVFERLTELTHITKLFGDVLSYLRLFALGLASSSLAVTFNQLAEQVHEAVPGLGLLLAILILLLGHAINLALGIISGFVHGLRLNFIEFFNWSLSAEGYPFRPFAKKEIET
jgi:V/A-type H+-transporting ATPase subunit I